MVDNDPSAGVVGSLDGAQADLEIHVKQSDGPVNQLTRVDGGDIEATLKAYRLDEGVLLRAEFTDAPTFARADIMLPTYVFRALVEETAGIESMGGGRDE